MRRRVITALVAAGVIVLAGCSSSVPGTARRAPYQPLPLASVTATMAAPVDGAIAYSRDGTLAATRTESGLCIRPAARPGASGAAHQVCADLGTTIGQVLFSPDGKTVAALEDLARTFRGRLWLVSTADGSAREVPAPVGAAPKSTGNGAGDAAARSMYRGMAWATDGPLVTVVSMVEGTSYADHLATIDPVTATATDLGTVAAAQTAADGTLAVAGHVAVLGLFRQYSSTSELVAFDLDRKASSRIPVAGGLITKGSYIVPLAVSPDGKRAALMISNPVTFTFAPPAQVDLASGAVTVVQGTKDRLPSAAAYSPDGSELAIVTTDRHGKHSQLLIAPTDDGPARVVTSVRDTQPGFALDWSEMDLLAPHAANGVSTVDGIAPWQLAG